MSQTNYSGPLVSGDKQAGVTGGPNTGYAKLAQTQTLAFGATLVQNATFYLPTNSQITSIDIDVTTAYNSATSATVSAGISTGATTYVSGVDVKTAAGRIVPAYSGAQLLAMSNITTNTTLVVTATSVGQPTAGTMVVTVHYIQTTGN
jgi:hypothetical protein